MMKVKMMNLSKYRKGKLVRHRRDPNSLGLILEVVRNFPIKGSTQLTPATYHVYWTIGQDKHSDPADCWYSESELEGAN